MSIYQRGKIYKIISDHSDLVYVGSTTQKHLSSRLSAHRSDYKKYLAGKQHYITSYKLLELESYEIVLVENFPCNSKEELHARERHYIQNTDNCVNKQVPCRTKEEYYIDNREKQLEQRKEYYIDNREKQLEQMKEYRNDNKEKIAEKKREYNQINKERINERRSEIIECECGGNVTLRHKARHEKSVKHQNYLKTIQA